MDFVAATLHVRFLSGVSSFGAIYYKILVRRMAKHNRGAGESGSLSDWDLFAFGAVGRRIFGDGYLPVSFALRLFLCNINIKSYAFFRYKPVIVASACFGMAMYGLMLWTVSMEALMVTSLL